MVDLNPNKSDDIVDIAAVEKILQAGSYIADRSLATAVYLALRMGRPLLLEGEAGVGKTELAKVLAQQLNRKLIRLQCYEGLDLSSAAYEWNFPRQMVALRKAETQQANTLDEDLYAREFLIARPLLQALEENDGGASVLLIDEIDRADEPFEAFLLEFLSEYQLSIPELGTITTDQIPIVIITSNRTREVHDALRRRCLYHWLDFPSLTVETDIVKLKAPDVHEQLRQQLVSFVQSLRDQDLFKAPGVAESIDWANALTQLDVVTLSAAIIDDSLGSLLKYQDDILKIKGTEAARILAEVQAATGLS